MPDKDKGSPEESVLSEDNEAKSTHDPEALAKYGLSEEILKKLGEYQKERKLHQSPLESALTPAVVPMEDYAKLQQQMRELQERLNNELPAPPGAEGEEEAFEKDKKAKVARKTPYDRTGTGSKD